jgi:prophage regulatory protein
MAAHLELSLVLTPTCLPGKVVRQKRMRLPQEATKRPVERPGDGAFSFGALAATLCRCCFEEEVKTIGSTQENDMHHHDERSGRILRLPQVMERVGLRRSSIYAGMRSNEFPRSVRIGRRAIGWHEAEINDFVENRARTGESQHIAGGAQ